MAPIERLIRLHNLMLEIQADQDKLAHFDLDDWVVADPEPKTDHFCLTAACAAGWAAMDPTLQSEGLTIEVFHDSGCHLLQPGESLNEMLKGLDCSIFHPHFDVTVNTAPGAWNNSWEALFDFFGLTDEQATDLFVPQSYDVHPILPQHVADKIKEILGR